MPKGKKTCPKCSTETGPRAFACKKCNYIFLFKVKSKEATNTKIIRKFDWKTLIPGDIIKVSGGPYFMNKQGEFIPMGYRGKFIVESLDNDGILAWGRDKHSGFAHIYMGPDIQNKETGIWKIKHKVMQLKRKDNHESSSRNLV